MPTFAHIESGQAINPMVASSQATYLAQFDAAATKDWQVAQVDDGALAGATLVNGKWVNPAPVQTQPIAPIPKTLSATAFNELCFASLGGGPTGMAAFQAIIDAAQAAGGAARACVTHYNKSVTFELSDVEGFFGILEAAQAMTSPQATAIIAAWPTV